MDACAPWLLQHLELQISEVLYLKNNSFVDGKLGNDVRQQQVTVVLGSRVDTHLG